MKKPLKICFLVALHFAFQSLHAQTPPKQSKAFEAFRQKTYGNVLPDFSYAGYKHGEENIPTVNDKVFDITKFGAVADDELSDKPAIEAAIKAAQNNGRGIVFFPKGKFLINEYGDDRTTLLIPSSNIVLRGSGSGEGGTEVFMKRTLPPTDSTKMWTGVPMIKFYSPAKDEFISKVIESTKAGSFQLKLENASKLKAGDWIKISLKQIDAALIKKELFGHAPSPLWTTLMQKEGIKVDEIHYVKSVDGNTLTLYSPIGYDIDTINKWKINKLNPIENAGVESIRFVGGFDFPFEHHGSWVDDSGWRMLMFSSTVNSWVKDCVFKDVSIGCEIGGSANFTALDCNFIGNGGHEALYSRASTNVLIAKCNDDAGYWHSIGVNAEAMNTVIWRCTYNSNTSFESHSNQPRNTLFDMMEGGLRPWRCGGDVNNLPHHMQNLVLWNYKVTNKDVPIVNFWPEEKIHAFRMPGPIVVGSHGEKCEFIRSQLKYSESIGASILPTSLYEAQLQLRLGKLPAWIEELIK